MTLTSLPTESTVIAYPAIRQNAKHQDTRLRTQCLSNGTLTAISNPHESEAEGDTAAVSTSSRILCVRKDIKTDCKSSGSAMCPRENDGVHEI